jgi:uncharacterized protein (TIGR02266 family)
MADSESKPYITPEIDKRQHRRARLVTEVRCESLGKQAVFLTRDVSVGGLFVTAKDPFPTGSEVAVSLALASGETPLKARGTVVYSLKGMGMGVQFGELDGQVRDSLQKFVDESA